MLTYILVLILLLPVTFLSVALENLFSPEERNAMGIHLENPRG
jgi:hypothetical protein